MKRTWNQHVVKQENKTLVLSTIIDRTPISRAHVAQLTGLNKGTVSSLVSELITEELVEESGPGKSSGGRRPVMLLFNGGSGHSVSIDLGVGYIRGVLTNLTGEIIVEHKVTTESNAFAVVYPTLLDLIKQLINKAPASRYGIIGIGVGVPAVVSHVGEILLAPNLDWKNINLKEKLAKAFNLPIYIENEANAGAYGEKRFGSKFVSEHMIYASIGMGIGIGMILDGNLYNGLKGFAGEIGHMTIVKDGRKCRCGNNGCWERYASEQALIQEGEIRGLIAQQSTDPLADLITLAKANDDKTIKLFEEIGTYIGIGLTNCINIFNPQHIVIGNQLLQVKDWLLPAIMGHIQSHTIGFHQQDLQLSFAKLGQYSTVKGMAAFTIEGFLLEAKNTNIQL
ncbi:Sugar kinase of the NBD/HSP70 family, may contain an N-terminal HTH domain [Amphibacillus marinus]|uniref:Sugar kinase of the NBD/HSP70 family, may contain an N-terminal HTH domain n=1 Tax=Amphibacillus marinus TaxID=872970 RepID=A0A1H8QE75_9BACI|nr:ROK family transcriptional regulator [Amphibacillus marinus]SEO52512.1 Sugar kinase of the NBD/HSP70 family, may contain an N-terminal HTH domain [Amphibacillus marinus]